MQDEPGVSYCVNKQGRANTHKHTHKKNKQLNKVGIIGNLPLQEKFR